MKNATIRQFQIFSVAAAHLSFARASEELNLTLAAVSLQIKQLEEVSGIKLFDRIGKRVFLTEGGQILLRYAREVLQALKSADTALAELRDPKTGQVSIAVTSTAEYFAPGLLARFLMIHPDVRVRLVIENRSDVAKLLMANEVDMAIMGRPPARMDSQAASIAPHPFVIVASANHPLARKKQVQVEEIAKEAMIVREAGSGTRNAMEGFFKDHGIDPEIGMEMSSNEAIKQAVMAGLGLSFISQHTLGSEIASKKLAILNVSGMPVMRHWFLVRHRSKNVTSAMTSLWDFIVSYAPAYLEQKTED